MFIIIFMKNNYISLNFTYNLIIAVFNIINYKNFFFVVVKVQKIEK